MAIEVALTADVAKVIEVVLIEGVADRVVVAASLIAVAFFQAVPVVGDFPVAADFLAVDPAVFGVVSREGIEVAFQAEIEAVFRVGIAVAFRVGIPEVVSPEVVSRALILPTCCGVWTRTTMG